MPRQVTDDTWKEEQINKKYYINEAESIVRELKSSCFDIDYIKEKVHHLGEIERMYENNQRRHREGVWQGKIE